MKGGRDGASLGKIQNRREGAGGGGAVMKPLLLPYQWRRAVYKALGDGKSESESEGWSAGRAYHVFIEDMYGKRKEVSDEVPSRGKETSMWYIIPSTSNFFFLNPEWSGVYSVINNG